ncbi:MAG: amidohydrolase [Lentisphaerae bacterium]|nr:amidohydrolase [Lentisphaerota bacterium]
MTREEIFQLSDRAIAAGKEKIIGIAGKLWKDPETGYRETRSSALLVRALEELGLKVQTGLALTGFRADLDTGRPGPTLAIMGEFDALIIPTHPEAVNGVVHACGHNTSAAALIGSAIGLKAAVQSGELCGKIAFIGTPAEEGIELEYRMGLIKSGKIRSIAGKSQLIRERVLDDVDIAYMHHLSNKFGFNDHNGSVCKKIIFTGKSCHASAPHNGINALNAMNLALHAISLLRESYSNSDKVRFHGIVSDGGKSVNILPDRIEMDYMLRAETVEKLLEVNRRFDNAVKYAAMAVECGCEIETMHYSMPLYDDLKLGEELKNVVKTMFPESPYDFNGSFYASCTDMGDVATVIPAIHGYVPGMTGTSHGNDYFVADCDTGCIVPSRINARLAIELLSDNAAKGKVIAAGKADLMPVDEYIRIIDGISGFEKSI